MLYSTVDARNGVETAECNKCCCESIGMRPGETNLMVLNYAPWAVPFGGRSHGMGCTPQFDIEQMQACPVPSGSNLPPTSAGEISFAVPFAPTGAAAPAFNGDLKTIITDPEAAALTFKPLSMYSISKGKITVNSDGTFQYYPPVNFNGQDSFFFTASDGVNKPVTFEAVLVVGDGGTPQYTPTVFIDPKRIVVDQQLYTLSFPIEASPAAKPCEVWRLTVRQNAYDCNYNCFWHVSCYDIAIKPC